MSYLLHIILTTFFFSVTICVYCLKIWCAYEKRKFNQRMGDYPHHLVDLDLAWSDKNMTGNNDAETSITSLPGTGGTTTLLLLSEVSNKLSVYPLTRNSNTKKVNKSEPSLLEVQRNKSQYQRPVDIIIRIEDFDEVFNQSDFVGLKGNLGLPVCDEDDKFIEVMEMKPITMWKALERQKARMFCGSERKKFGEGNTDLKSLQHIVQSFTTQ